MESQTHFLVTFRRIFQSGYVSFRRNDWLSAATIVVMSMMLFVFGMLIFAGAFASTALGSLESKVDITVYFKPDASEENIVALKSDLESLEEVKEVLYISRDDALARFRDTNKENALISDALAELGENPLEASLNIRAKNPSQYGAISDFLLNKNYLFVDKINYFENQLVINRLGAIIGTVRGSGVVLVILLAFVAVLVAFNTIRLGIYTMREEIGIMRLMGAEKWFVRGPFLVSGVLYGVIAGVITTFLFFPLAWLASPKISLLMSDFNLFQYFLHNFWQFLLVMLVVGIGLGVASSFIAIHRYLEA